MLIETIHARSGVSVETLENVALSASKRYKVYTIPKKTGGVREISQPSRMLKALQRWLTRNVLSVAPVHKAATAYQKGSSIRRNALHHAGTAFTLRMDFSDFFPSFDQPSVVHFLETMSNDHKLALNRADINFAARIFCKDSRLTIGAPSSPALTNAMMYDLDTQIQACADAHNVVFTRYADDLFFSSFEPSVLEIIHDEIRKIVAQSQMPVLRLNDKKTIHLSKARHRSVTGMVLTTDGKLSLGRQRKRRIKSLVHKAILKQLEPSDRSHLAGLIAFAYDADPDFVAALSNKFKLDVFAWSKTL